MGISEDLERLEQLKARGVLTDDQFEDAKEALLDQAHEGEPEDDAAEGVNLLQSTATWLIAVAVLTALVVGIILKIYIGGTATYTVNGPVTSGDCLTAADIEQVPVTIRNQDNAIIANATTSLEEDAPNNSCKVTFSASVPKASFYEFDVGAHTGPNYTFDQLQNNEWKVAMTFGAGS